VALGTVADVVRLDRVNRIFVEQGIARIRNGRAQPGVAALFTVAARDPRRATAYDLGFVAGPRLNAAGRLADMSLGIRCLLAETASEALALAGELDRLNRERREVEEAMRLEAFADIESAAQAPAADAIVFARGVDGELKGSGRSIEGFHLRDGLDLVAKRAPGIVRRFGGHAFAAGVSIDEAALSAFAAAFEDVARERLTPALLRRTLETDGTLGPGELTFDFANVLRDRVWGQGFPAPVFDDRFVVRGQRLVGGRHMQLSLERSGEQFDGIAFAQSEPLPPRVHAAYRLDIHEWNGLQSLQLVIEHWLPAERN
jgi:single-stranded-DNA-specific exonuclease